MAERFKQYTPAEWSSVGNYLAYANEMDPKEYSIDLMQASAKRLHRDSKKIASVLAYHFTPLCYEVHRLAFDSVQGATPFPDPVGGEAVLRDIESKNRDIVPITKSEDQIILTYVRSEVESNVTDYARFTFIRSPIGEYGSTLSFALTDSARRLISLVFANEAGVFADVNHAIPHLIDRDHETFQRSSARTTAEGIATMAGALSLLMFEKVGVPEWDNDPLLFMRAILNQDLLTDLSLKLNLGELAENMFAYHRRWRTPIVVSYVEGKPIPKLSSGLERYLAQRKQNYMKLGEQHAGDRQQGCPVGHTRVGEVNMDSGISKIGEAFYLFTKHFYKENESSSTPISVSKT